MQIPSFVSFRTANAGQLADALQHARDYTLALFDCFAQAGYDAPARVPQLLCLNPPLWELGHIAWFAEWFILRHAAQPPGRCPQRPAAAQGRRLVRRQHRAAPDALEPGIAQPRRRENVLP
jgi:hypothetical protein